jgi:siroheme synthase
VTFVTPRVGDGEDAYDWAASVAAADTGVIYMGVGQAEAIAAALIARGKPASLPVAIVENASLPDSQVIHTTLGALPALAQLQLKGPAVMLLGEQFRANARARDAALEAERCRSWRSAAG